MSGCVECHSCVIFTCCACSVCCCLCGVACRCWHCMSVLTLHTHVTGLGLTRHHRLSSRCHSPRRKLWLVNLTTEQFEWSFITEAIFVYIICILGTRCQDRLREVRHLSTYCCCYPLLLEYKCLQVIIWFKHQMHDLPRSITVNYVYNFALLGRYMLCHIHVSYM